MNDSHMAMSLPYRNSPPSRRQYEIARQQKRAAATAYSTFDTYDEFDTMPAGGGRVPRRSIDMPRSHPMGYPEDTLQRRPSGGARPPISFGEAASQLNSVLLKGKGFYEGFLGEFEAQTQGIRDYADTAILDKLWQCKIKKDFAAAAKKMAEDASQQQPLPTNFRTMSNLLSRALHAATTSSPPNPVSVAMGADPRTGRHEEDIESMRRLVKKLQGQHRDLIGLILGSQESSRKMINLIQDIDVLLTVLKNSENLWNDKMRGQGPGPAGHGVQSPMN